MTTLCSRRYVHARTIRRVTSTAAALVALTALAPLPADLGPIGAAAPRLCLSGGATHEVASGDTWFGIAAEADVSMGALLEVNGAEVGDAIHPGDELCLPAGATPTSSAPAGERPAPCAGRTLSVASGDSWFQIARRVQVAMRDLLAVNDASTATVLQPGMPICLPAGAVLTVSVNAVVELDALPVQGPCWYGNTWRAARGDGRRHEGVDLITAPGNLVYAVTDGTLTRRAWEQPGSLSGNAWWLTAADGTYYFYAHLSDFAPGLSTGSRVQAGEIIGFVGTTGSSATPHLHFEIHPGGGDPINPYPTMRATGGCKRGAGYVQPGGWIPD